MFWNFYVMKYDECMCKMILVLYYLVMEIMVIFISIYFMNFIYFFYFNIKVYVGCDMLVLRLVQFCYKQMLEQVLMIIGNFMYVIFCSDVSINGKGFSVFYKFIVGGKCYFSYILIYCVFVLFIDDDFIFM